jgi:ABC-type amino acid transport substrate-binding protein
MEWEDHIDALLSDQVDISIKHTNTPERAFNVEFTIESILCEEGRIVILSSNDLKKEADLNQAHWIISVAKGSSQEVHVRERYPLAQVKILTDAQETFDAVLNGQADACLHDTKVPGFLSLHTECTILTKDDGQPITPYKDCVHPCIKPGDQRFLNWLNSWMAFNKATGKFDRIMNEVEVVHKEKFDRLVTK